MDPALLNGLELIAHHYASEDENEDEEEDREWGDVEIFFFFNLLRQIVLEIEENDEELEDDVDEEEPLDDAFELIELYNGGEAECSLLLLAQYYHEWDSEDEDWLNVETWIIFNVLRQNVLQMNVEENYEELEEDGEWGDVEIRFFLNWLRQMVLEIRFEENYEELEEDGVDEEHLDAFELIELHNGGEDEQVSDDEDGEEVSDDEDGEEEEEVVSDNEDERADVKVALEGNGTVFGKDDVKQLPQQEEMM